DVCCRGGDRLVQALRAEGAAGREQHGAGRIQAEAAHCLVAAGGAVQVGDGLAHRHPDAARAGQGRAVEGGEHCGGTAGTEPVGESRAAVRLMDDERDAQGARGEIGGRAHVAAEAGDHVDLSVLQEGAHGAQGAGEAAREAQCGTVRAAREGHLLDRDELEAGRGDEIRLEPLGGAEHGDLRLRSAGAELIGGGQQRGDVAGAAATGEEDARGGGGHQDLRVPEGPRPVRRVREEDVEREEFAARRDCAVREGFAALVFFAALADFAMLADFAVRPVFVALRGAGRIPAERRTAPIWALIASAAPGSPRAKDRSTPSAVIEASSAEPPEEMNGSGTPITGSSPVTTIMFTNAWPRIQAQIPATVICRKRSSRREIMRNISRASTVNSSSTPRVPIRPSSSPMIAKM